jgi:hypothetical protein
MEPGLLFMETVGDLIGKLESASEYEGLKVAGLLRQLLLDGMPLADVVNRRHRLKLSFVVNDHLWPVRVGPRSRYWIRDEFDPHTATNPRPVSVRRDAFMGQQVAILEGHPITARDLIQYLANKAGAIHYAESSEPSHVALAEWMRQHHRRGRSEAVNTLAAVGRVATRAIYPLWRRVLGAESRAYVRATHHSPAQ